MIIIKELISVIVPVYKVEKYLSKCIDSIINQTYKNLEIILIDDGSPDECPKICDEYSKKDNRIKVIHKQNGGLSDARNFGIDESKGDYITFIDSDDYIDSDYIELLYKLLKENNSDISICNPKYIYENNTEKINEDKKVDKKQIEVYTKYEAIETMLYQKEFDTSAWGKLYKSELLQNIRFPKGKMYEDLDTIYKIFLNADKITYTNLKKYFYLQRETSIMGKPFNIKDMDIIDIADDMYKNLSRINKGLENASRSRKLSANFYTLMRIENNEKYSSERKRIIGNINECRVKVLLNRKVRMKNKIAIILSYISYNLVRNVFLKMNKKKN